MPERPVVELKDLPLPSERIDGKISDLVRALNGLGVKTMESCEGHLDKPGTRPRPWVNLSPFPFLTGDHDVQDRARKSVSNLRQALEDFAKNSAVTWVMDRHYIRPDSTLASNQIELATLQESFSALAQFIFDKYVRPKAEEN